MTRWPRKTRIARVMRSRGTSPVPVFMGVDFLAAGLAQHAIEHLQDELLLGLR